MLNNIPVRNTIQYKFGSALEHPKDSRYVIAHICNDIGVWGAGFALTLNLVYPFAKEEYKKWFDIDNYWRSELELGLAQIVKPQEQVYVANMIAQHGVKENPNDRPIRYEALAECLADVFFFANQSKLQVVMPRIGCGLAGGTWDKVEPLILKQLEEYPSVPTFVYTL